MRNNVRPTTKHQKIMASAIELFRNSHNVKKVSVEDIARRAGVSPTTIYNNFGTREKLVTETVKHIAAEALEKNRATLRSDLPVPEKIGRVIDNKVSLASELHQEVIGKLLSQDASLARFVAKLYEDEIKPLWMELVRDGKRQGYIEADLDENTLLLYLDILRAGTAAYSKTIEAASKNPETLLCLSRLMLYGFINKEPASPVNERKDK